jgi:hypothetical protein
MSFFLHPFVNAQHIREEMSWKQLGATLQSNNPGSPI